VRGGRRRRLRGPRRATVRCAWIGSLAGTVAFSSEDGMSTVTFEYAAKFICGLQKDPEDIRLTRGLYGTEIKRP
jgi:hypothetical protein